MQITASKNSAENKRTNVCLTFFISLSFFSLFTPGTFLSMPRSQNGLKRSVSLHNPTWNSCHTFYLFFCKNIKSFPVPAASVRDHRHRICRNRTGIAFRRALFKLFSCLFQNFRVQEKFHCRRSQHFTCMYRRLMANLRAVT